MEQKTFQFLGESVTLKYPAERREKVFESIKIFEQSLQVFNSPKATPIERILLAALRLADEIRSLKLEVNDKGQEFENWLTGIQQRIQYSLESNE